MNISNNLDNAQTNNYSIETKYEKKYNEEDLCYSIQTQYYVWRACAQGMESSFSLPERHISICPNFFSKGQQKKIASRFNDRVIMFVPKSEIDITVRDAIQAFSSSEKGYGAPYTYSQPFLPYKFKDSKANNSSLEKLGNRY